MSAPKPPKGTPVKGTALVRTPDGRYYNTATGQYVNPQGPSADFYPPQSGLNPHESHGGAVKIVMRNGKPTLVPTTVESQLDPKGGTADVQGPGGPRPLNVRALQTFLVRKGYQLAVDGKLGRITKSALADYLDPSHVGGTLAQALDGTQITGKRNPKNWNILFGAKKGPTKPQSKTLDSSGNTTDLSSTSTAPDTLNDATPVDYRSAQATVPDLGYENPADYAKYGPQLFDVKKLADAYAGEQYDPQIYDTNAQVVNNASDKKQALHDIETWMGQVGASQKTAAARDHAISEAGKGSIADIGKSLVASLGGSSNAGSGLVADSAQQGSNLLTALGANQDQYQSDLAPILSLEKAGQMSSADAKFEASKQALLQRLTELKGARGQAVVNRTGELNDKNNAILDSRMNYATHAGEYNDSQRQQGFNNKLALNQAITNSILANARVISANSNAQAKADKPAKGAFGNSSTSDRQQFASDVLSQITQNGKAYLPRSKAIGIAQRIAGIYWPNGGIPNGTGIINNILAQAGY